MAGVAAVDAKIMVDPWIRIPADRYYFRETFFTIPVLFLAAVLASGAGHLLAKALNGKGSFAGGDTTVVRDVGRRTAGVMLIFSGTTTHADWVEAMSRPGLWQVFSVAYQLVALAWYLLLVRWP